MKFRGYLKENTLIDDISFTKSLDNLKKSLGFNPDMTPIHFEPTKYICPKCNKKEVVIKSVHEDTDMEELEGRCKNCGYCGEPDEFKKE